MKRASILLSLLLIGCDADDDDDGAETARVEMVLFFDGFDEPELWTLDVEEGKPEDLDSASASIENSELILRATQEFGCPHASAFLAIDDPPVTEPLTEFTLNVLINENIGSGMGSMRIRVAYSNILVELFSAADLVPSAAGPQLLVFTARDGMTELTLDGAPLEIPGLLFSQDEEFAAQIEFEVEACAADAFADSLLRVESIELLTRLP